MHIFTGPLTNSTIPNGMPVSSGPSRSRTTAKIKCLPHHQESSILDFASLALRLVRKEAITPGCNKP